MIKDMPATERPRERLRDYGAGALSTAELLAIILRTGTKGQNVLNLADEPARALRRAVRPGAGQSGGAAEGKRAWVSPRPAT